MTDIKCYEGPPLWILPEALGAAIQSKIRDSSPGVKLVSIEMLDGKKVKTVIIGNRIVELPDPYTSRDLKAVREILR